MIHLKIRTEFSFGQTFAPIDRVIQRLKEIGCSTAGIVDIDSTWGHMLWHKKCLENGIKPALGVEISVDVNGIVNRMWFLAKNKDGLAELYANVSLAHKTPHITKSGSVPCLNENQFCKMSDNIFKFAGENTDGEFLSLVGAVVDYSPISKILNIKKKQIAQKYNLRTISVSDNSFAYPDDLQAFELISKSEIKTTPQFIQEQLENQETAISISKEINIELPKAPMVRADGDLEKICRDGIIYRKINWTQEYENRLKYELDLIKSKDFESYFIIVADMVHYAKDHMLVGPSRGSAAGSLVCYLARITEIDPIPPKLYFERFIDVTRTDLPDIDLDFPDDKRHIVFEYMAKKYGDNNVAHIGTISEFKPKSALIQVCKKLGISSQATATVKIAMITRSSADARANNCLEDTFNETEPGKEFIAMYPHAKMASMFEGHASHTGVHAAGLLICNESITNYAVVDNEGIAHIDKISAEQLGLLKIDVLGLRTLGILEDSGINVDWYNLKFNDEKTFKVFNDQRLCGIFQFEGDALRSISERIEFNSIVDIDAVTALARPGTFAGGVTTKYIERKNGKSYEPIHPLVEEHMKETFGLPVYQEQTLAIVREIGKFDWKDTSTIRKAMSKSMGKEFFDKYWDRFKTGAMSQGISENEARKTWEMINAMGSWQMNKAHTYSYAVISYWTAYLKAHHPLEFSAANLRNLKDEESAVLLLREIVKEGVEYIPFDIEKSELNWCVKDGKLIGGFTALKGFGEAKAKKLIEARNNKSLTTKQIETIKKSENIFANIFPIETKYKSLYYDPLTNGVASKIERIKDIQEGIDHGDERVFIGELIHKNPRNANEDVLIKKRGGKIEKSKLEFLDLRFRDDTGQIDGRVVRGDYQRIGKEIFDKIPIGSHLLIRAKFFNGIRYAFVQKWKRLDQ